jgi:uncharacterized repeat protein (TIGR03803 family)
LFLVITVIASSAQTLTTLADFNGTNGLTPYAPPVRGRDGNFYGTTGAGEGAITGTVFKVTPDGTLTTLHQFTGADGTGPVAPLAFNGTPATFHLVSPTYIKAVVPSGATTGTIQITMPSGTLSSSVAFEIVP